MEIGDKVIIDFKDTKYSFLKKQKGVVDVIGNQSNEILEDFIIVKLDKPYYVKGVNQGRYSALKHQVTKY